MLKIKNNTLVTTRVYALVRNTIYLVFRMRRYTAGHSLHERQLLRTSIYIEICDAIARRTQLSVYLWFSPQIMITISTGGFRNCPRYHIRVCLMSAPMIGSASKLTVAFYRSVTIFGMQHLPEPNSTQSSVKDLGDKHHGDIAV